ncbi:HTH-type transcriptional regulator BhcR [Jannaschia pohangensis]|uniref:Transcriptional regulator, IclR family n=1 Tax=Jannaschia pohangensis TaxID=390807 RepID=A0A1I3ISE9_9RHOB|nr:HTH-type transcriptional regulator BhcR [Jannaschia pohangensis]SFI50885.1 transcriptional regulator, IclR family [Jannaschia pohangensis]
MNTPKPESARLRGRPKAFNDKTDQNTIKALDRAMHVLRSLSELENATLTTLAQTTGDPAASVYRILVTLQAHDIVELDTSDQTWHVGPGAFQIGSVFLRRTSLIERAREPMRDLMEATGETANLGIRSGGDVLFVSQIETHAPIRAFFPPGTRGDLHASGIGKVLLSAMEPERRAAILPSPLPRYTDATLSDPEALAADLTRIAARGYSVDDEEKNTGMRCIAAPVRNLHGEVVAGISVSGPTSRVAPDRVADFARQVIDAAETLSQRLGARPRAPRDD